MIRLIRLFLARHGNTFNAGDKVVMVGSKTDLSLTDFGQQQALQLAHYFKEQGIQFDKVYCGDLKRQYQTAETISNTLTTGVQALDELDYGAWEGLTDEEIQAQWPQEFADWNQKGIWPANVFGMSFEAKKEKLGQWIEAIKAQDAKTVLAISSGGIIRLFLSLIPSIWADIDFKHYKMKTGHFCELWIQPEGIKVIRWNESP